MWCDRRQVGRAGRDQFHLIRRYLAALWRMYARASVVRAFCHQSVSAGTMVVHVPCKAGASFRQCAIACSKDSSSQPPPHPPPPIPPSRGALRHLVLTWYSLYGSKFRTLYLQRPTPWHAVLYTCCQQLTTWQLPRHAPKPVLRRDC